MVSPTERESTANPPASSLENPTRESIATPPHPQRGGAGVGTIASVLVAALAAAALLAVLF